MKDHFILNTRRNVIRQALLDFSQNDPTTLAGLVLYSLDTGTSWQRLCQFGARRLRVSETAVSVALAIVLNRIH